MEKISGILPSSARVSSVDMRESSPVRPGTPSFGRAMGVSALNKDLERDMPMPDTARKSVGIQQQQLDWRSKDAKQAAIAAEMSDKFFIKNRKSAEPVQEVQAAPMRALPATVDSVLTGFKTDRGGSLQAASAIASAARPQKPLESSAFDEEPLMRPGTPAAASLSPKSMPEISNEPAVQPEGLYPKGSFLDRSA